MPLDSERAFLVFQVAGTLAALPLEGVEKIAPMAELARPPGLPAPLAGILNWGGASVPVLRLGHLLQLPEARPGLYSMLILTRPVVTTLASAHSASPPGTASQQVAMLVDRVNEIVLIPGGCVLPVRKEDSFNACIQGTIRHRQDLIHLLSPEQILLAKEQETLAGFLDHARSRITQWETTLQ